MHRFSAGHITTPSSEHIAIDRPVRWDHPLDPGMLTRDISWMLDQPPFSEMNRDVFPSHSSLEDVLRHDSRILRFDPGDIVIREGDYGGSAYLVLRGSVQVFLESLWQLRGKSNESGSKATWFDRLKRPFSVRKQPRLNGDKGASNRRSSRDTLSRSTKPSPIQEVEIKDGRNRIFLQDINAVIDGFQSEPLGVGEIFGEMAAITRSQHRYTVAADKPTVILEIRWQGLRIMRRDRMFREYLDTRFRETSLQTHLRETSLFRFLDDDSMNEVIAATKIESIGDREWFSEYKDIQKLDVQTQIEREPIIAKEGLPVQDLILIRAGFARLSFEHGRGHQTVAYLGRGQMHGLAEITSQYRDGENKPLPYQESLRALGFVDILRVPREVVLTHILPKVRSVELPSPILKPRYDAGGLVVDGGVSEAPSALQTRQTESTALETSLVEFLVDERLINGKQTMLIDLDRCTGCDECVKACATTHDGTPRFIRNGPQFGPLLFAHACMHCADPVCMIGCPTGAIARNQETGVISIDPQTCIGCKVCSESCPYDNIVMVQVRDDKGRAAVDRATNLPILQASKCDLCHGTNGGPACQTACPHEALFRIDTSQANTMEQWLKKRVA
jgi:Fe-S-cluster-containing dehydrogenase component/CRP-like cAMP-binding protein